MLLKALYSRMANWILVLVSLLAFLALAFISLLLILLIKIGRSFRHRPTSPTRTP